VADEPGIELDDDLEEFLEAWAGADREAAVILSEALVQLKGQPPPLEALAAAAAESRDGLQQGYHPFGWIKLAAGFDSEPTPRDDAELLLACTTATIAPLEETGLDPEEEANLISLERADWLGAIVSTVRAGAGADAAPASLAASIRTCPEVELGPDDDPGDDAFSESAFRVVALAWKVLGLTDRDQRLTDLGAWVLPRALARAWGADFDAR
jgi:hypothetical protein